MKSLRLFFAAIGVAVALGLGGCAAPAKPEAMTVKADATATVNPKLKGAIRLDSVTGGEATNPMWASQVDNASFRKALQDSLSSYGYLAADPATAKYAVSAKLAKLDQPLFGLTLDVKSNVGYELKGAAAPKSYIVNATGSATFSDAFAAVERLRISNERSILENIREFLNQLGRFND